MSAKIELFPGPRAPHAEAVRQHAHAAAMRYVTRAEEAFQLLSVASTELERSSLCEIAEAWLDLAEAALPVRA